MPDIRFNRLGNPFKMFWEKLTLKTFLLVFFALNDCFALAVDCTLSSDCSSCMQSNGKCAWCKDEVWFGSRCDHESNMGKCNNLTNTSSVVVPIFLGYVIRYRNFVTRDGRQYNLDNISEIDFSDAVQVKPKRLNVTLRRGQPVTFSVKIKPAKNFPVSLYYLMDMSSSMLDDLSTLQSLGKDIAAELKNLTTKFKLGFGTFVDKTVAPYVRAENFENRVCILPGKKKTNCTRTFGYKHVFNFSDDPEQFQNTVKEQIISRNKDNSEGSMDALMQVAVCTKKLQWVDNERRIVVLVTDARPHIALDGKVFSFLFKLGGIFVPNDGKCYLDDDGVYTRSNTMDYPSFAQLKIKLKENSIVPIFAVTKRVMPIYQRLTEQWAEIGANIGELTKNSSNIQRLIRESYESVSQTVRLTHQQVEGISVNYKPTRCEKPEGHFVCKDVAIEEEVEFSVTVNATSTCPEDYSQQNKMLHIVIPGFGVADVSINLICDCPCEKLDDGLNSTKCNGTGDFKCGICNCPNGRYGVHCECDGSSKTDITQCLRANETEVCSGLGECICGKCVCYKRNNTEEIISGEFCECKNYGCDGYRGQICGGTERGKCECGKCKCNEEYLLDNCGELNCDVVQKKCFRNKIECSGNGRCECGTCVCDKGYGGDHCENCVSCSRKCSTHKDCVFCLFEKGEKDVCQCDVNVTYVNESEEICVYQDVDGCYIIFSFEQTPTSNQTVLVQKNRHCTTKRQKKVDIGFILGLTFGIVFLVFILLLAWKLFITSYDKYEYRKFEKEKSLTEWSNNENPIYLPSQQEFSNPTYSNPSSKQRTTSKYKINTAGNRVGSLENEMKR